MTSHEGQKERIEEMGDIRPNRWLPLSTTSHPQPAVPQKFQHIAIPRCLDLDIDTVGKRIVFEGLRGHDACAITRCVKDRQEMIRMEREERVKSG